jgi:molybdenum cofactor guanylyltransferase
VAELTHPSVCGLIIAGGLGTRFGGADKAWLDFNGTPLIEHVARDLRPQVGRLLVSANRNLDRYRPLALETLPDLRDESVGPLAGLEAARAEVHEEFVQLAGVDACSLAPDLVADLMLGLQAQQADIAVPVAPSNTADGRTELREQWLHALMRRELLAQVTPFLNSGGRKVQRFFESHARIAFVHFPQPQSARWFHNINTPADLERAA